MAVRRRPPSDVPLGRDEMDWDELFRLHAPRLRRRVARRVADAAIVEDVVQETFIQAYRRWSTYEQAQPIWPWLVAIAANLAWRWSQASHRAEAELADPTDAPLLDYLGAAGSDDHVANLDRRAAMRAALDGMTEKHRRILVRWELRDRSAAELAAAEGMTEEELRATVVRARRSLRRRYYAVSGEGTFGWLGIGAMGAALARWRDRLVRVASSGGWAEAAGALAAAPVVAAGMAMITLAPAPAPDARRIGSVAEQSVAVVDDGREGTAVASDATAVPPTAPDRPRTAAPTASSSVPSPPPTAAAPVPTLAAGPAAATVATSPRSHGMDVTLTKPGGDTRSGGRSDRQCDKSVVVNVTCQVLEAIPGSE